MLASRKAVTPVTERYNPYHALGLRRVSCSKTCLRSRSMAHLYAKTSSMRIRRCLPTLRFGMVFWSRSFIENGRETFNMLAAWTAESSALSGTG